MQRQIPLGASTDLKEVTVFIDNIIKNTRQVSISLIFQIKD
jgi:hypothetical protein